VYIAYIYIIYNIAVLVGYNEIGTTMNSACQKNVLPCQFEVTCHTSLYSTDIRVMPGDLYWEHNDWYSQGHAFTNQIKEN
jgi:hypothetical protein